MKIQSGTNTFMLTINKLLKFILDRLIAAIALIIFAPIMLFVAIAVYFKMGSPVIFAQDRPGKNNRIFKFYKFRTMTNAVDEAGNLLSDEQRLTAFGEWLRQTSLDELPQLWNVLKGDMSFIGPRPLLVCYLDRYTPEQARRHEVLPGITGWAQVNGRRQLDGDWEKKFELDVWYVDNWNLWLDLKIFLLTILVVLKRENVSQDNHATGEEFFGTQI